MELYQQNRLPGEPRPLLERASAGTSHSSTGTDQTGLARHQDSVWKHWIDSRTDEPPVHQCVVSLLSDSVVHENGNYIHPVTGVACERTELWSDDRIKYVGEENTKVSMVLKVDDEERNARGLVVRVGQYCQGILKEGAQLTVERWKWIDDPGTSYFGGWWDCEVRIGDGSLPCDQVTNIGRFFCNDTTIQSGALEWRVIEDYRW